MKKRIISMLMTLSLMITLFVPTTSVNAELGIKNELQVSLMAALNIVPGYPSSYDADANVSTKDFVTYAYRLIGMEASDLSYEMQLYGLDENSETIDAFTAIKIILNVVGYDKLVSMYNNDYYTLASRIEILTNTGINVGSSDPVTYNQMVMLFWNALNMDTLKMSEPGKYDYSDKTIMEYYLKIYEGDGIVNANNIVAVDGGKTTGIGEVRIGDENYLVGNTITEHLIASNVKFYYYNGDDRVLKWIESNKSRNQTLLVYGNDVVTADNSSVVYDDNKRKRTIKLDRDYLIVYNGKAVTSGEIGIEAILSLNSQNSFIDNDNNGSYNVVIIKDYEYYLVDAISKNTYIVNDHSAGTSVDLSDTNTVMVYENGVKTTVDAIQTGTVIAVAKSVDSSVINVEILKGTISGEISAISSKGITLSGTEYNVSPSYAGDALKLGRSGTFYFDNYGRIVRCVGMRGSSSQYGYLINFYSGEVPGGDCYAEILAADGTRQTFDVKQYLNINNEKCNLNEALLRVTKDQLVSYSVNSENRLLRLDTANNTYIGRDTATDQFSLHFKGAGKYRKNNMCFNSKYLIDSTTPIFVIPYSGDKEDYALMDPSLLVNNVTYDISVYDIDDYMYTSCIVLKENFTEPENLRSKRSLIITDVFEGVNADDEQIIGLEGYQQGGKVSYEIKNREMRDNRGRVYVKDLQRGDVVQLGLDVNGNISAVQLLFKSDDKLLAIALGTENPNKYWEGGTMVMPDLSVSFGTVRSRNTSVMLVDADGNDLQVSKDPHKFAASTYVYVYENGKIHQSNKSDIFVGDTVYVQEYQGNLHEVLIIR